METEINKSYTLDDMFKMWEHLLLTLTILNAEEINERFHEYMEGKPFEVTDRVL